MIPRRITILSFSLIIIFALTSFGQESERNSQGVYFELGEGDYIKEWLLLGPFDGGEPSFLGTGLEKDFSHLTEAKSLFFRSPDILPTGRA